MRMMRTKVKPAYIGVANFPKKQVDPFYNSPEWRGQDGLRERILRRAGYRCEAIVDGHRCENRAIIADHIVSRKNGGADTEENGRALCRGCDNRVKEDATGKRRGGGEL